MKITKKLTTRSFADLIALSICAAVSLVGVGVLAGWHLHLRPLIQVVPGTIPIQYNTALCFLTLGVGGLALVSQRGHRVLPAVVGAFVALMGALVVFEYITGTSLGIDTALFYPWERTLSADPGRMALTTAISVFLTGDALVLI